MGGNREPLKKREKKEDKMGFLANDNVNEETKIVKRICLSLSGLQKHQFWEDCYFEEETPIPLEEENYTNRRVSTWSSPSSTSIRIRGTDPHVSFPLWNSGSPYKST